MKIGINGFGRIGRAVFRIANSRGIKVAAINDLQAPEDSAYLLKHDSVYGDFGKPVKAMKDGIVVGRDKIKFLAEKDPSQIPWKELGVDVVIESTGFFTKREGAEMHLKGGAKYVLITAPAKGPDKTIVPGVNQKTLTKNDKIISVASCTTNATSPMVKTLNDAFGIEYALFTTVHAYTSTQRTVDGFDKKDRRRSRAAAINIIPTTTGAATAVIEAIPELNGKIDGMAMRVPVPAGSIVDLVARLKKKFTVEEVNKELKRRALGDMKGIMDYSEESLVSSDIIGNSHSSIIDGLSTKQEGPLIKVLSWYDNEFGYSNRVVDTALMLKRWV